MKKILVMTMVIAMLLSLVAVSAAAIPEGCTAIDITNDVKFISVPEMYKNGVAVVRDDAVYVECQEYDLTLTEAKAPGADIRIITISDFDEAAYRNQLYYDYNYAGDGTFAYSMTWANANDAGSSKMAYKINIPESGEYEFVFVGAAQIKAENVGNDAKDRGFCYSIDGGQKYQVNISDTPLVFRDYLYEYSMEEAIGCAANGTYEKYVVGCVYNIKAYLTAGEHTLEYYHLEYSGDTKSEGNTSRLNYAGFYYQKAIDEIAMGAYTYPEAPVTTEEITTQAPDTTNAPDTDAPDTTVEGVKTDAPDTKAPDVQTPETTKAPEASGGCGSMVSGIAVALAFAGAAFVISKKR